MAADASVISLGRPAGVDVVIPRTTIAGWMTLAHRGDVARARAETRALLIAAGYDAAEPGGAAEIVHEWTAELAVRTLAVAVREPQDHGRALATVAEWRELDDDQIAALWAVYERLAARHDPLGDPALTEATLAQVAKQAERLGRDAIESVRITEAGALRDYFGRAACDLTDTEVWVWATARAAALKRRRKAATHANANPNPDFVPPAKPVRE